MSHKTLSPIERAVAKFDGSPTKLAAAIGGGVLRQHVEHWLKSDTQRVPEKYVRQIHDLCLADPACWEFCPESWWRIWPDLRGVRGAPAISEAANESTKQVRA